MSYLDLSLCAFNSENLFLFSSFIPIVVVEIVSFHYLFAKGKERRTKWHAGKEEFTWGISSFLTTAQTTYEKSEGPGG